MGFASLYPSYTSLAEPIALDYPNTPAIEQMRVKSAAREFDRGLRRGQQKCRRHPKLHGAGGSYAPAFMDK